MIEQNGKYYLYRHIRLDKNEPFYIGIGTKTKSEFKYKHKDSDDNYIYRRAFDEKGRNKIWLKIKAKTEIKIEILLESNDYTFIKEKEKEFIKLYGRKNLKAGTLCNLTDGAEGNINRVFTPEIRANMSKAQKGKKHSEERRIQLIKALEKSWENTKKKCYQYDLEGNFIKEWNSVTEAGNSLKLSIRQLSTACKGFKNSGNNKISKVYELGGFYWSYEKHDFFKREKFPHTWNESQKEKFINSFKKKAGKIKITNLLSNIEIIGFSKDLSKKLNLDYSTIMKCLKNKYGKQGNIYKNYKIEKLL